MASSAAAAANDNDDDHNDYGEIACAGAHPTGAPCACHLVEHETIVYNQYHGGKVGDAPKSDSPLPFGRKVAPCLRCALGTQTRPGSPSNPANCCLGQLAMRRCGGRLNPPAAAAAQ
uniref:Uncharacterized protein n=1 Tax=Plectus sambesii TaxID=2011161 RepID=A0A914VSY6_9BILA